MNNLGLASPSINTNAMPGLAMVGKAGSTTLPALLVYLAALAEVNKTVVTAVPGAGVGMKVCCSTVSKCLRASLYPCTITDGAGGSSA